jgi:hypothetical protein
VVHVEDIKFIIILSKLPDIIIIFILSIDNKMRIK